MTLLLEKLIVQILISHHTLFYLPNISLPSAILKFPVCRDSLNLSLNCHISKNSKTYLILFKVDQKFMSLILKSLNLSRIDEDVLL